MNNFKTLIIGRSPSKGARSPILWNKVFKKKKINCKMYPQDILNKKKLKLMFKKLNKEKTFLGGAVTIPYKEDIAKLLKKNVSNEVKKIKAVNCLYRKNGKLWGTNTDGEAAVESLKIKYGNFSDKKILICGFGGAGKAIAAYIQKKLKNKKNLEILIKKINQKEKYNFINYKNKNIDFSKYNIVINVTSLGFGSNLNLTPISLKNLKKLKLDVFVFDIIYDPPRTNLLKLCDKLKIKNMNGLDMNLRQAAIAFKYTIKNKKIKNIKEIMNIMRK